jgi:hypothetical protein
MQPSVPQPQTPAEPLPLAQVSTGMAVADAAGETIGTVTAVQMPGTDVRPDLPAAEAEHLMSTGYLRTDGGGLLSGDLYAGGGQVATVVTTDDSGEVTLTVGKDELRRAG